MHCWSCHEPVESANCVSCGNLQPPPPKPDFYLVLGLKRRYGISRKEIDGAWRKRSRLTHPDRFAGQAALQRRLALQWTAHLNEARRVLRDPVARAWYLSTGSAQPPSRGAPTVSQDFLEEVFELQMGDPEERVTRGGQLKAALEDEIAAMFEAWEQGEGDLEQVPERLSRLKYATNLTILNRDD